MFNGGPGATGRSFSDKDLIVASITERLMGLPEHTVVKSGHGDDTTIKAESANISLVPLDSTALGSNTPTSKSVIIRMVPVGSPPTMDDSHEPLGADDQHKSYPQPEYLG